MCDNEQQKQSRKDIIEELFSYHPATLDQKPRYEAIRAAAKDFAYIIVANTTTGADQSAAIRKLRECVMTANASIALNGLNF